MKITVIITTIGRRTLEDAVASCEGHPVVVVGDGCPLRSWRECDVLSLSLGRRFGHYGCVAFNVGAALAQTEYVTKLDDDDEFLPGALESMEQRLAAESADIWIPGLRYNDGHLACLAAGLDCGNVACPTMRAELIARHPIRPGEPPNFTDWLHVREMVAAGHSIRWYGRELIAVRPQLPGHHGAQQ